MFLTIRHTQAVHTLECLLYRNKCIFQGKELTVGLVSHQINLSYGEIWTPHQKQNQEGF